ncbi:glycoside hydrolase domain-containing protein [Kribbella sp. GL6]|uniref:glycoside hydrolase domain-containing protein n=1 Tax=Kribbella sp. GL6 TaxID=3419765 RepID=UPI003CFE59CC
MPDVAGPMSRRSLLKGAAATAAVAGLSSTGVRPTWAALPLGRCTVTIPEPSAKGRADASASGASEALELCGARNSFVIGQVLVSAAADQPCTVTVEAGPLQCGDVTLAPPLVMVQVPVPVDRPAVPSMFPAGRYFDPLPPLVAVGDWVIGQGETSGLAVKYRIPEDALPGTYTGSIALAGGGAAVTVPVSFEVWDTTLPTAPTMDTAFNIWYQQVALAHRVEWGTPEWDRVMGNYFEFQAGSRVGADDAPITGKPTLVQTPSGIGAAPGPGSDPEPEWYLDRIKRYVDDPRIKSFRIPMYATDRPSGGWDIDTAKLGRLVAGVRDLGLIDKAYFYYMDEPVTAQQFAWVREALAVVKSVAPEVPNIVTLPGVPSQQTVNDLGATCTWQKRIYPDQPNVTSALKARGDRVWSYMMVWDAFPWVDCFIDDSLVGTRILPWTHRAAGSDGILFWSTTCFGNWNGRAYVSDVAADEAFWDRYVNPYPLTHNAGDGYLLYPGAKYGLPGPVSSLRYEALREGMQDVELVTLHETAVADLRARWGVGSVISGDPLAATRRVVFNWVDEYRNDAEVFESVRRNLGREVTALTGALPVLVDVPEPTGYNVRVVVAAERGVTVTVNGRKIQMQPTGSAAVGEVRLPLAPTGDPARVVVTARRGTTATTVERIVHVGPVGHPRSVVVNSFERDEDLDIPHWGCTVARSPEHATAGASSMLVTYPPDKDFASFQLTSTTIGTYQLSTYDTLEMEIFNPQDRILVMVAKFHSLNRGADDQHPLYLSPGPNKVVIPFGKVRVGLDIGRIECWLWGQPTETKLYVDNIRLTTRRPESPTGLAVGIDGALYGVVPQADQVGVIAFGPGGSRVRAVGLPDGAGTVSDAATTQDPRGVVAWSVARGKDFLIGRTDSRQVVAARASAQLGGPSIALDPAGNLMVVARGADGAVYGARQSADGVLSDVHPVTVDGAPLGSGGEPQLVLSYNGKVSMMVIAPDGQPSLYEQSTPGSFTFLLSRRVPITGAAGRPALGRTVNGVIAALFRRTDGTLVVAGQNSDATWFTDEVGFAGQIAGDPVLAMDTTCRLVCLARTTDNKVAYGQQLRPGLRGAWTTSLLTTADGIPVTSTGPISVAVDDTGVLHAMSFDTADVVQHLRRSGPATNTWLSTPVKLK